MARRENELHSALLSVSQPFLTTNPLVTRGCEMQDVQKKVLNRSGSGVFASFSTFTGTGEAVQLSKLSATAAAGEKK